jgi:hypothetical protein
MPLNITQEEAHVLSKLSYMNFAKDEDDFDNNFKDKNI